MHACMHACSLFEAVCLFTSTKERKERNAGGGGGDPLQASRQAGEWMDGWIDRYVFLIEEGLEEISCRVFCVFEDAYC